jgi:hypothetical protein
MDAAKTREADRAPENADATSKETLEEIEQSEKGPDDTSAEPASGNSELPSPDGTGEESREPDDAGPM